MYKWTVMVYMAGDNNLDSNGVADLKEMKRVGSTDDMAIIAQFDRSGPSHRTKRYFVRPYDTSPRIQDDVVQTLGETNSGSKEEFIKFLQWGMKDFTADRYLVIIWGHGSGVMDEDIFVEGGRTWKSLDRRHGLFRPAAPAATKEFAEPFGLDPAEDRLLFELSEGNFSLIAPDDEAKDFLDNIELKEALNAAGNRVDILGMDACLMSMVEVCYQLRGSVGITVASEAQSEVEGWPYERFLSELAQDPDMLPEQLSRTLVAEFVRLYEDHENVSATLAACRVDETPKLAAAVNRLADTLIAHLSDMHVLNAVVATRNRAWADEIIETVDLYDFCWLLRRSCDNAAVDTACDGVLQVLDEQDGLIISFDKHPKDDGSVEFTHGIGIYFPQFGVSPPYTKLDFVRPAAADGAAAAPRWGEFIKRYVAAISR